VAPLNPVTYEEFAYLVATAHAVDPESPSAIYDFLPQYSFILQDYEKNGLGERSSHTAV